MRCEEIQERFIDLLYSEPGGTPANQELEKHIASCPGCRRELEGLRGTRGNLQYWLDEPPRRPVLLPRSGHAPSVARHYWPRVLRYAGVAAMVAVCLLALANAEIVWNKDGFSFRTRLFAGESPGDFYTKAEVRDILKRVMNDSESHMIETNYLMLQRMLMTVEQERLSDIRLIRERLSGGSQKN